MYAFIICIVLFYMYVCVLIFFSRVLGVYVISSVLSHHNKNLKWQPSDGPVLQLSDGPVLQLRVSAVLFRKERKIHPWGVRACWPKRHKEERERERETPSHLAPLFICFFFFFFFCLPLDLLYVNWASQECCLFYLSPCSGPRIFLCSIFMGFSLPCLLATTILDCFSYSNHLTGDLSNQGIKPVLLTAPALAGGFLTTSATCMHIHRYKTRNWLTDLCRLGHPICRVCC